jgi:hypothetical protein
MTQLEKGYYGQLIEAVVKAIENHEYAKAESLKAKIAAFEQEHEL